MGQAIDFDLRTLGRQPGANEPGGHGTQQLTALDHALLLGEDGRQCVQSLRQELFGRCAIEYRRRISQTFGERLDFDPDRFRGISPSVLAAGGFAVALGGARRFGDGSSECRRA